MNFYFTECVHLLLAHNAQVKVKNSLGWNPLAEAISYGDRQTSLFTTNTIFLLPINLRGVLDSFTAVKKAEAAEQGTARGKEAKTDPGIKADG